MEFKMSDMMNDPTLSPLDRQWVVSFQAAVDELLSKRGFSPELSLFTVASTIGLDVSNLHKEGTLLYALWVVILNSLQKYVTPADMKYPSIESFLDAYPGWFTNDSDYEKRYLWLAANWMNILFRMITARKNKGLVLQVVPKLIEGWDAKYVTGSGQTKATANRVHIFETEGNTKANQRGKAKAKKKPAKEEKEPGAPKAKNSNLDVSLFLIVVYTRGNDRCWTGGGSGTAGGSLGRALLRRRLHRTVHHRLDFIYHELNHIHGTLKRDPVHQFGDNGADTYRQENLELFSRPAL